MIADFDIDYLRGLKFESEQDRFYREWYEIHPVNEEMDRMGIDRIFVHRSTQKMTSVQYKGDEIAARTKRVFIETVSNDKTGAIGWALKCPADVCSILIPGNYMVLPIATDILRDAVPTWLGQYKLKEVQNRGYKTKGVCVPIKEFEKFCLRVMTFNEL